MTQVFSNPVKFLSLLPLLPAERKFARCLAEGERCMVGNGKLPEAPIGFGNESESNANVIRGEVVRFFAYGGDPDKHPIRGAVIALRGAWILGVLDLLHANIPYALDLNCCRFVGSVVMLHAGCGALYLNGSHLAKGLTADGITTKKGVNLCDGFSAEGEVRLLGANIGGNLSCEGGGFHNPKGYALVADGITTKGDVRFRDGFSAEGEVRLLGANVGGGLSCADGRFHNLEGCALNADGITTKGDVNLRGDFSAEGEVRLLGANVGGDLSCESGRFHNLEGCALNADGITTKGGVNLHDGFSAEGEVRLLGANVGGDLSCESGRFHNPKGDALSADRVTVKGGVFLFSGFSAEGKLRLFSAKGEVRLSGANVGGNLSCEGGKFHNPKRKALSADGITVKGDVNLPDAFSAEGEVRLPDANVGGRLNCEDGRFHNLEGYALNVEGAIIHSGFIWRKTSGGGKVELGHAKIGVFADDADSWKPFEVVLDGFTYNSFAGPVDAQFRLDWLGKRPRGVRFSPLPYEQAAKVLFGMGQAKDAREILLEKERLQTKDERTPLLRKIGRWFWDEFAGYGYRLRRTVAWSLAVIAIGWGVFSHTAEMGGIVPHQPAILASHGSQMPDDRNPLSVKSVTDKFPEHPEFNPLVFSADVFIPVFALHQEPFWYPVTQDKNAFAWLLENPEAYGLAVGVAILCLSLLAALAGVLSLWRRSAWLGEWILRQVCPLVPRAAVVLCLFALGLASPKHWYWLEIGFGWVLTSLFLLSITGLLRPRQSSGEKG